MNFEEKINELKIVLPGAKAPVGSYVATKISDKLLFISGQVSIDKDANSNATVTLKLINKDRWKLYDLEYQSVSILDIEKIGYDSKIKRQGIEKLVKKMLSKS